MNYSIDESNPENRKLITKKNVISRELILETSAHVSTVLAANLSKNCSYCFKYHTNLSNCGGCLIRHYCNKECQALDWKTGHKQECGILKLLNAKEKTMNSLFLLALRVLVQKNIKGCEIYEKMGNLLSNKTRFPEEKIQFFKEMSIVLMKYIEIPLTIENIEENIELLCRINTNAFTIHNYLDDPVALGIFIPSNFINHSCEPNAQIVFIGRKQRVFALKDLLKDSEITISYAQKLDSQENIRKFLFDNYQFDCKCVKCLTKTSLEVTVKPRVYEILELIGSQQTILPEKRKLWLELTNYKGLPKEIYAKVLAELACNEILNEEFKNAYKTLKQYIECITKMKGGTEALELNIGWKYAELSKLAKYLGKIKSALQYGEKALTILQRFYKASDEIEEILELNNNVNELQDLLRANNY